jgi:hypothetical protein
MIRYGNGTVEQNQSEEKILVKFVLLFILLIEFKILSINYFSFVNRSTCPGKINVNEHI